MSPAFVTVSRVTGEGQELECNHSIEWQNAGLKEKKLRLNISSVSLMSSSISQKALCAKQKMVLLFCVNSRDESSNAIQQLELISRSRFHSWL